jgi:hypothetical protein
MSTILVVPLRGEPRFAVGAIAAAPGSSVLVPVSFNSDTNVPSFQFDLLFSTNYLATGSVLPGPANTGYFIFTNSTVAPGVIRVLSVGFASAVSNGVAALVQFAVSANAPDHDESLVISNIVVSSFSGDNVPATGSNGVLAVVVPPRFVSILRSNTGPTQLQLSGAAGRTYVLQASSDPGFSPLSSIATNQPGTGNISFQDTAAASFPVRFYRALVVP